MTDNNNPNGISEIDFTEIKSAKQQVVEEAPQLPTNFVEIDDEGFIIKLVQKFFGTTFNSRMAITVFLASLVTLLIVVGVGIYLLYGTESEPKSAPKPAEILRK